MEADLFSWGGRGSNEFFNGGKDLRELTRALPRRSVASPVDQCSPSNGIPARCIAHHISSQGLRSCAPSRDWYP
jgi:hypothetical protein